MLPIEEALGIILENTPLLEAESLPLFDVTGRVLRRDAVSDMDLPPFDRARMDGFAFRSADTLGAAAGRPIRFRTAGEAAAGHAFTGELRPGEAVRIMTGAPVPAGADAVQKIEVIRELGEGLIEIEESLRPGQFITPRGIEARQGDAMALAGAVITPAVSAVLASFGYASVCVSKSPRVALISTGSELVEVDQKPGASQIRNSNTYSLSGYVARAGGLVVHSGIVSDDLDETKEAIGRSLQVADVVILSGGVSMGDYDLVKPALLELGAEILVEKVAMHPGKPTVFARIGEKVVFGLPGNPVSVAVSFHIFARPALLKMQQATEIHLPRARVIAARAIKGAPPRRSHQPAILTISEGRIEAEPLKWSGSSDLVAFMRAEALIVVPEDRERIDTGEIVEIISIR